MRARSATVAVLGALLACGRASDRTAAAGDTSDSGGTNADAAAAVGAVADCSTTQVDGNPISACVIQPANVGHLRIAPAPRPAKRDWTIAALDSTLRAHDKRLGMAMNAGIFRTDGTPSGLLVANGIELSRLATGAGPSARDRNRCAVNFYCLPNGVFFISDGEAHVLSTQDFARSRPPLASITLATQSGPMLVEAGKVARRFPASFDKRIPRNAVCVRNDGTVVLVLAPNQTHATLADLLIARFACRDALFLDGSISALYTGQGAPPSLFDYGAIVYVAIP
ncbi:MAG TPA: phosphodiester glycosidase family protein [Gemmatimonadaceae bacterium]|nr:phosphodiester glycosidase family protein [Gemmatimonadaceae bacterium]